MTPIRCLIVDAGSSAQVANELLQALRGEDGIDAARAQLDTISRFEGHEIVFLVVDDSVATTGVRSSERLIGEQNAPAVIAVGRRLSRDLASTLIDRGIADFIVWPCQPDELMARLARVVADASRTAGQAAALPKGRLTGMIGTSAAFVERLHQIPVISDCDVDVLILGETGTGKELFAQAVHYLSQRASRPWVAVNCGAIPLELMESELFGHVRGAFTNASGTREGLIAESDGGTLFLDDVDCLPLAAQAKLLRFLQEREYRPLGSNRLRHADVRVIASTNRQLCDLCAQGQFRQDLYYRLNVMSLSLPPLRARREDIAALARHFASAAAKRFRRPSPTISSAAYRKMMAYQWPGNVRELQHVMERAVLLANGGVVGAAHVHAGDSREPAAATSFRAAKEEVVAQFEKSFIEQRLRECDGNVTHAAREARKNRRAFFELMRKHAIEPERFRSSK